MSASLKQNALTAIQNAIQNRTLSPCLTAIFEAIKGMTDDDKTFRAHRELYRFSKRIADGKGGFGKEAALDYCNDWAGEWEIRNTDLETFGDFCMWLERFDENGGLLTQDIRKALRVKRLQQAYERVKATGLTAEHCKLAARALWQINTMRGDGILIYVQGKRPFGNSNIAMDVFEICGWEMDWPEDKGATEAHSERAWNIIDELAFALPLMAAKGLDSL